MTWPRAGGREMPKNHMSPHDRYIRSIMTNPNVIKEFFKENLPEKVRNSIDFTSIEPQKDSFIDDKLKLQIADLLYSVKFDGEPGYLYLLVEHASTPDKMLPFRLLKYMVAVMDHHLTKTKSKKLPIVYPLVLYTGKRPFRHSMDLFDLFENEKELAKEFLTNPYQLIDLNQIQDDDLKKEIWFGTAALIAKHIYDTDFLPTLEVVINILNTLEKMGEVRYIENVICYIVGAGKISDKAEFVKILTEGLGEEVGEKTMKISKMFEPEIYQSGFTEGKIEGEIRGEIKGKIEGKQETQYEIAFNLLNHGLDLKFIQVVTGLSLKEIESIKNELKKQIH